MRPNIFLSVLVCCIVACSKTNSPAPNPPPVVPPVVQPPAEPNLYIGGMSVNLSGYGLGVVWKNGVPTLLSDSSMPVNICLHGDDLYTLGWNGFYLKNNIKLLPQCIYHAYGMAISAAGDIYLTCNNPNSAVPGLYWKNGVITDLTSGDPNIVGASTSGIAISDTDVYICGQVIEIPGLQFKAVYWKNGVINYLPGGTNANTIAVSGGDVYATGDNNVYWKNGQVFPVGPSDKITGIAFSGSDVYVSGLGLGDSAIHAFYFKNGQKIPLPKGIDAFGIAVHGSDVYCVGSDSSGNAVYWKNTEMHILGPGMAQCILIKD